MIVPVAVGEGGVRVADGVVVCVTVGDGELVGAAAVGEGGVRATVGVSVARTSGDRTPVGAVAALEVTASVALAGRAGTARRVAVGTDV